MFVIFLYLDQNVFKFDLLKAKVVLLFHYEYVMHIETMRNILHQPRGPILYMFHIKCKRIKNSLTYFGISELQISLTYSTNVTFCVCFVRGFTC